MSAFVQSTIPIIKFSRVNDSDSMDEIFNSKTGSYGCSIINYSFSRSVNNITGEFSITIKDGPDGYFIDLLQTLDVVTISESHPNENEIDFYGVVTKISFSAMSNGFQKTITVSGKSIDYLFEFLTISEDVTAMALVGQNLNAEIQDMKLKLAIIDSNSDSVKQLYKPVKVIDAANTLYETFRHIAIDKVSNLSNTDVIKIIDYYYGKEKFISTTDDFEFKYPITNNMFGGNQEVNIYNYLRSLLPQNVYEIYGVIINGKPKIMIREVPFRENSWNDLNQAQIKGDTLINYTLTKSMDEVYTAFYSYLSNSPISLEWYQRTGINSNGNPTNEVSPKRKKYGFKLLTTNFIGFTDTSINIEDVFLTLNKDLSHFYSNLDEMYDATITVVQEANKSLTDKRIPKLGEKLQFLGGQFYITGEEHSWTYEQSAKTTFHCERGGLYDGSKTWENGFFKPIPNVTKKLKELDA